MKLQDQMHPTYDKCDKQFCIETSPFKFRKCAKYVPFAYYAF